MFQKDCVRRLPTTLAERLLREAKAKYDNHKGEIRHTIVINFLIRKKIHSFNNKKEHFKCLHELCNVHFVQSRSGIHKAQFGENL
jgi:hypothetical protein